MNQISINDCRNRVNGRLSEYLDALECPEPLKSAMSYSVTAGGKRIRPLLLLAAREAPGGAVDDAMPFACAIEFIHTYSLIHDDLPAMDNDDIRRGKPTNHKVFGEWAAILAGDGLLNLAYEVMADCCAVRPEPRFIRAMAEIARAAGARGMVGGQVLDMSNEGKDISIETVLKIDSLKTGALITAALSAGAAIAGADCETAAKMLRLGEKLGIAFQLKDDLLNAAGDARLLGKPAGTDAESGKATYLSVYGYDCAEHDYNSLSGDIMKMVGELPPGGGLLRQVAETALNRSY